MKREFTIPKILIIVLVFYSSLHPQTILSIDTVSTKFFPLAVGNIWVYKDTAPMPYTTLAIRREKCDSIFVVNNKRFYHFTQSIHYLVGSNAYNQVQFDGCRIDSINGGLYVYSIYQNCTYSPSEFLWDSLRARLYLDTARTECGTYDGYCIDTQNVSKFNLILQTKYFKNDEHQIHEYAFFNRYAKNIGIIYSERAGMGGIFSTVLVGCVINGVLYGDTGMYVGINSNSKNVPSSYRLYQNYPNPFNPTTKIKFDVASNVKSEMSNTKLIIYDILGSEIAMLVNEKLAPGNYEVEFDASNYPSGVYYYKLETGSFSESKKMVLVK